MPRFLALALSLLAVASFSEVLACEGEEPVSITRWQGAAPVADGPVLVSDTRLALAADRPEILTFARLKAWLTVGGENSVWLELEFSFADPQPFGLPYTVQHLDIAFQNGESRGEARIDWSSLCQNVGRSMFPGQSPWRAQVRLEGVEAGDPLENLELRLWGSRN